MRISSTFVFTLAILLSCIAMTTPSFAKMLKCERYDTRNENTYALGAFDGWFPKSLSLSPNAFSKIPERKSLIFKQEMRYLFDNGKPTRVYTLFTNGQLNLSVTSQDGGARYKCNMKPEEVLAAQTSPSTPSTAATGCFGGNLVVCDDDFICQKATSARSGSREWEITRTWESYVKEAKRRGLSCGVSEASSQSTTQSSTSSTTSTPSKADNAKAFCKDIGFKAGTEKFGECVLKMMDK